MFTESGLEAFQDNGGREYLKYKLIKNKAIYLERLGRTNEALKIVQDVWGELNRVTPVETLASLYWLKSELLRKSGEYKESVRIAQEGIYKATLNNMKESSAELWATLGSGYCSLKDPQKAEICYDVAMNLAENGNLTNPYVRTCLAQAELHIDREEWVKAETTLHKAVKSASEKECSFYLVDAYLACGTLYALQGLKDNAINSLHNAINIANEYEYTRKEHQAWLQLANIHENTDQQEFQKCITNMYRLQMKINERSGRNEVLA